MTLYDPKDQHTKCIRQMTTRCNRNVSTRYKEQHNNATLSNLKAFTQAETSPDNSRQLGRSKILVSCCCISVSIRQLNKCDTYIFMYDVQKSMFVNKKYVNNFHRMARLKTQCHKVAKFFLIWLALYGGKLLYNKSLIGQLFVRSESI